ncbi:DUF4149 domain-containing protein [Kaistella montana]|uniref:DUF4149 domain-containing protein n=1 Tax=Kaistella montana TaxID=1849733 RepID=A0ABW5K6V2_9FLAO|nr:DUF4149 domain-containing protein [Kaistella montana]MCQ4034190.1 hypothetical protein [Kaistella montana]
MKYQIKYPLVFAISFFWFGLLLAISFIETPMKFQVPGITLPVALQLGKTMFRISTCIQLVLMVLVFLNLFLDQSKLTKTILSTSILLALILILEKFWMLPILDERANILALGKGLPPTPLHDYFIYAESFKAILLLLLGFSQLKKIL